MENPYEPPQAKIEGTRSVSWALTGRFLAIVILSGITALLMMPRTGILALAFPAVLAPCLFILPDFLFPARTKVVISDEGIDYEDFSQVIHAPWNSIRSLGEEPFFRFIRVGVDHPLANFCLSPHHPTADALKAAVERRLFGTTADDETRTAPAGPKTPATG